MKKKFVVVCNIENLQCMDSTGEDAEFLMGMEGAPYFGRRV
jgi:hypothetical protein